MKRRLYFISIVTICFLCSGCMGKFIGLFLPPATVKLNDTTEPQIRVTTPAPTIKVNKFIDMRDNKKYVGRLYNNVGEHFNDIILFENSSLDTTMTAVVTNALMSSGYNVLLYKSEVDRKANYVISANIWSFEIVQETLNPVYTRKIVPDGKFSNNPINNFSKQSRGYANIGLNIQDMATSEVYVKNIEIKKDEYDITAQTMATMMVHDIVNKASSILYEIYNSNNKH